MEKKKKSVQRLFKPPTSRHKREAAPGTPAQAVKGRKGRKEWVKPLIVLLVMGAAAIMAMASGGMKVKTATTQAQSHNTASAECRNISSELSSSGTFRAKDTYSITSMVESEVLSTGFEEGDQVEKGQVLYETDKFSMESQLTSLVNFLSRSQSSCEDALEDYNNALGGYSGNTYKTTDTGYIRKLYISAEGKVNGNTKLADVYSDSMMEIRIPSLSGETAMIGTEVLAAVILADTGEQVAGTVKAVVNRETVLTDGWLVRMVIMQVQNPGGSTTSLRTMAQTGEFMGSEDEAFEASVDTIMNADLSISVEVESLLANIGDYVTKGTPVFKMADKSADKLIQSYKGVSDRARESAESAQDKLDSTQDSYDNYTIKAPISGQVITKNLKVGDNITKSNSSTMMLATIYDLSSLTFEMSVDELDIKKVKVGQKVEASVDAFEGQTFSGTVTNVSLESICSDDANTYLITVTLGGMRDLLSGMSVDGAITPEEANDVLTISTDALMRGNQVYVKDDTMTEQQGSVPAGLRSAKMETGLVSNTYVEITSNLSEGGVVYAAESNENSNSFMMMMDGGTGGPPGRGGNMGGQNRGSSGGRRNR